MAFSKYEPDRADEPAQEGRNDVATRRAKMLRYAWWLTIGYTAMGFVFLGLFWQGRFP